MAKSEYKLDLARIADLWMHGSVVRSWLLELAAGALKQDPKAGSPERVRARFR
jgi:6-phosphogluconate dehydrogenase